MSENVVSTTELTAQYAAQVSSDLERNTKEQQRIEAEIASLQTQLTALQHDQSVLENVQQALGITAKTAPDNPAVPGPRDAKVSKAGRGKGARSKKAGDISSRSSGSEHPARKTAATVARTAPTLVDLVRGFLAEQKEPRSAAEIAVALGQTHPERKVKTTVVRTTVENLVARNQAQRSKQGSSVFYTSPDVPPAAVVETQDAEPAEVQS